MAAGSSVSERADTKHGMLVLRVPLINYKGGNFSLYEAYQSRHPQQVPIRAIT